MDDLDNPSTRLRVFANAWDSAEPASEITEDSEKPVEQPGECQAPSSDHDATAPVLADAIRSQDEPIDDARLEKIEKIKKALADGTYNVSAEELARKLIEHMLEP